MKPTNYTETSRYRCLNEHFPRQSEEFYLLMCGIENCTPDKGRIDRIRGGWHLHVIISGEGVVQVGDMRQALHAGQLFMVKPGEQVTYFPVRNNPWAYCWVSFDGRLAGQVASAAGFDPGVYWLDSWVDPMKYYRVCDQVLNTPQLNPAAALKRLGLTLEFLSLAVESRGIPLKRDGRRGHQPLYHREDYILHAMDYIQNNYSSITVADVARYLGIDRSYFSMIFKQLQGISPNEYLLQVRMRQSSHMLLNLAMSIQDIARYVGYEDSLTFSKTFKRFFGVSPKYYREMSAETRPELEQLIAARRKQETQE